MCNLSISGAPNQHSGKGGAAWKKKKTKARSLPAPESRYDEIKASYYALPSRNIRFIFNLELYLHISIPSPFCAWYSSNLRNQSITTQIERDDQRLASTNSY